MLVTRPLSITLISTRLLHFIVATKVYSAKVFMSQQILVHRNNLKSTLIDLQGRDLVIGFSEPALKTDTEILGAPVNARLLSYFLPAVEIAKMQTSKRRPRLIIISGIKAAIK